MEYTFTQKSVYDALVFDGGGAYLARHGKTSCVSALFVLATKSNRSGTACASLEELGAVLGMTRQTAGKAVSTLEELGLIIKKGRGLYDLANTGTMLKKLTKGGPNVKKVNSGSEMLKKQTPKHHSQTAHTLLKELPLRGSSSAQARTVTPSFSSKQEKVLQLEKVVCETLGQQVWDGSTNWGFLLDQADWDLDLITHAVIAYDDKVLRSGQKHHFSRLLNFVTTQKNAKQRRNAGGIPPAAQLTAPQPSGDRLTKEELRMMMEDLQNV